jgi:L-malate glycosyltransferase
MWACGLPVIATQVGGLPYLIRNEADGLLVPSEDPLALSRACLRLLGDSQLAERLSLSGRARAQALSWEAVRARWQELLFAPLTTRMANKVDVSDVRGEQHG